jgi:hypothetical protein
VPEGFSIIHITTKELDTCPQARCYRRERKTRKMSTM